MTLTSSITVRGERCASGNWWDMTNDIATTGLAGITPATVAWLAGITPATESKYWAYLASKQFYCKTNGVSGG